MSQNGKLELFSKLFDFEKRGNNYMAKSDGAVITIYQNGNHQIQGKNVDYAKKMIDFLHKKPAYLPVSFFFIIKGNTSDTVIPNT